MRSEKLLITGVLAVALAVALAVLLPGFLSPEAPVPDPTPGPKYLPIPEDGIYVNATCGYAVTCPVGWFYTESGESVWFSSPDKHEEVRVNVHPLSDRESSDKEGVLRALNATYAENLHADIGAVWISTEKISLAGIPAYESSFSVPIVEEDRYTFVARYGIKDDAIYSVMHTVFPVKYDIYTVDAAPAAESFRFL